MSTSISRRPARRWSARAGAALTVAAAGLTLTATAAMAAPPNPVPVQPPNTQGVITMLDWISWIVGALGVLGILIIAGTLMVKHRRGEAAEAAGGLGWVLGGCILAAGAGGFAGAMLA